jgi:hypothetical protein
MRRGITDIRKTNMQFKDAAYQILIKAGEPLHYNEITDRTGLLGDERPVAT